MAKPAINVALNNSSIDELLNQTGSSEKLLEVHQSLNSNSISELLPPKLRNMAKPAIDVALNNSSIDELISPKTSNLTQSEVDLPPLTSSIDKLLVPKADRSQRESFQPLTSNSISLAKLLKLQPTLLLVMGTIPHFVEQGLDIVAQASILSPCFTAHLF